MEKPKVYLDKWDLKVYNLRRPTPVQIVCGDCSGRTDDAGNTELLPVRTFLAMDGRCYTCGGGSFVVASQLCSALHRTITEHRRYRLADGRSIQTELNKDAEREIWEGTGLSEALVA